MMIKNMIGLKKQFDGKWMQMIIFLTFTIALLTFLKKNKHYNLGDGESYCFPNIPLHPTTHLTQPVKNNRRLRPRCGWQSRLQVM